MRCTYPPAAQLPCGGGLCGTQYCTYPRKPHGIISNRPKQDTVTTHACSHPAPRSAVEITAPDGHKLCGVDLGTASAILTSAYTLWLVELGKGRVQCLHGCVSFPSFGRILVHLGRRRGSAVGSTTLALSAYSLGMKSQMIILTKILHLSSIIRSFSWINSFLIIND
ncbi:unnamed protein product [Pieris macdunnoughi]|uniref:Uncharacterized protein n=1 Tax=Pieris macdunnoughi TaxID=345717 RepID=A0A821LZX7_9NEOP|nr:unnamed protein product [Pieris macdunnoughi]